MPRELWVNKCLLPYHYPPCVIHLDNSGILQENTNFTAMMVWRELHINRVEIFDLIWRVNHLAHGQISGLIAPLKMDIVRELTATSTRKYNYTVRA